MVAASWVFWDKPSWGEAEAWAIGFLLLPSAVSLLLVRFGRKKKARFFLTLINGKDGRWSTSKAGYLFWTYALLFVFIAILLHTQGEGLDDLELDEQYLLLLGIPSAAALVAKGLTQSNVESDKVTTKDPKPDAPQTDPVTGIGQLLSDDEGNADLLDFQYLAFNLLLLGYFLTRFLSHESVDLPTLPDTLVALSGVAAAGYIAKKGLEKDGVPTIRQVIPEEQTADNDVRILGVNFATPAQKKVSVLFDGKEASALSVDVGDYVTELSVKVPSGMPSADTSIRVVAFDGRTSAPWTKFKVL